MSIDMSIMKTPIIIIEKPIQLRTANDAVSIKDNKLKITKEGYANYLADIIVDEPFEYQWCYSG